MVELGAENCKQDRSDVHKECAMKKPAKLVVSIVSHGHACLVRELLHNLECVCDPSLFTVVLTENIREPITFSGLKFRYGFQVIQNSRPKGFACNHNFVFRSTQPEFFCVLNPDITLKTDPFGPLLEELNKERLGIVAPVVLDPSEKVTDSARLTITPFRIGKRILGNKTPDYCIGSEPVLPDWVAGMFMLFSGEVFAALGGFDESYRMYCEDADICIRAHKHGYRVAVIPWVAVYHAAQRASHRNIRYCAWHVNSLCRFIWKHHVLGRKFPVVGNLLGNNARSL